MDVGPRLVRFFFVVWLTGVKFLGFILVVKLIERRVEELLKELITRLVLRIIE